MSSVQTPPSAQPATSQLAEQQAESSEGPDPKISNVSPPALAAASLLLVPIASYGFIRLFEDPWTVLPIIASAVISGGLAILLRTLRISLLGSLAVSIISLIVLLEIRYAPGTQQFGLLPTRATLEQFRDLGTQGILEFQSQRAPVESVDSLVAAAIIGSWFMAFLTDWGALRLRLAFEPVLPGFLLFVFASILGSGAYQQRTTILFAAAVVLWAVVQRTTNLATQGRWLVADARRGPRGIAISGLAIGGAALLAGLFVGPALPGADAEELYYWRDRGDPTRYVISPYVSIQNQLAEQTDVIMFTVTAERPAYWRVAGLDTYDEGFWQTKGKFEPESGNLPGAHNDNLAGQPMRQEFRIEALGGIWLPAAFSPSKIIESDIPATWNSDTSSLTVSSEHSTSDGATYVVESRLADFTPAELNFASAAVPDNIGQQYLALPDDLTPRVFSEALTITAGSTTRYEQMLALQEHFRSFEYSIRLGPREGDPIEQFLDEQVGFCQQFSGTFALMARSLGAPARVAVGFTWGERTENENEYRVSGRHTHAWPEVWFEGLGWVAFEPTPGRGAPNAGYTQHSQAQDAEPAAEDSIPSTTVAPDVGAAPGIDPTIPGFTDSLGDPQAATDNGGEKTPWRTVAVLGLILAYLVGVPVFHRLRRFRARHRANTSKKRIEVAWAQASEALELGYRLKRQDSETRIEFSKRAGKKPRVPIEAVSRLAQAITIARFSPRQDLVEEAVSAQEACKTVVEGMREEVPGWQRWLHDIDPRRALPSR